MSEPSLKDRVLLYNLMQLPGQPQMMHVGSSNLVNDLAAEVTRLTRQVGEATGRIETDGRLIAELEAEVTRLTAALAEAEQRSASEYTALQAKSVRDGIAREQRAREEEREACAKLADYCEGHNYWRVAKAIRARSAPIANGPGGQDNYVGSKS